MKTPRLFVVLLFFISALSTTIYAGQSKEDEGKGTIDEPDCDYSLVRESL